MKQKLISSTELCYLLGLSALAMGAALLVRAGFGVPLLIAPSYLLHLAGSSFVPWFCFGVAEVLLQGIVLLGLAYFVRRMHWSYLLSFVTVILYALLLEGCLALLGALGNFALIARIFCFALGLLLFALGQVLISRSALPPLVCELVLRESKNCYGVPRQRIRVVYATLSACLAVVLSFIYFGFLVFRGLGWGTLVALLVVGILVPELARFLRRRLPAPRPLFPRLTEASIPPPFPVSREKRRERVESIKRSQAEALAALANADELDYTVEQVQ